MNELLFEKREIVELSYDEMMTVDGGTTVVCAYGVMLVMESSVGCGVAACMAANAAYEYVRTH
jgi:hypothetical protein